VGGPSTERLGFGYLCNRVTSLLDDSGLPLARNRLGLTPVRNHDHVDRSVISVVFGHVWWPNKTEHDRSIGSFRYSEQTLQVAPASQQDIRVARATTSPSRSWMWTREDRIHLLAPCYTHEYRLTCIYYHTSTSTMVYVWRYRHRVVSLLGLGYVSSKLSRFSSGLSKSANDPCSTESVSRRRVLLR